MAKSLTVASLFAGLGGFSLAFRREGFSSIWANEFDKFACATHRHNHPDVPVIECNVKDFHPVVLNLEPPDILTAGFPCQPFSAAGERLGLDDERGTLYQEILRIVREFGRDRPAMLLLENVGNLLGHDERRTYPKIENDLRRAGYWMLPQNVRRLNTRIHTDIPHNRERVFIIALSTDVFRGGSFVFPEPQKRTRPITDFLDTRKKQDDYFYFDIKKNRFGAMIWHRVQQGDPTSVYQLRRCYVREHKSFVPALTANMGDGGHNVPVIVDRWGIRKLTPGECAAFQGFVGRGASFPKLVSRNQSYKQIGNSVTIPLVQKLAAACRSLFENPALFRRSA
ncbi:MAG TPA: DNA (cytosine-5-)-methyltransferase [Gemmatimonadaceae bacterium]|nr:DNA (cytosine-5-)-methyltransferase [Gemmatimonadaceae bacterium]